MDKNNFLNVWYETKLVGQLWRDNDKIGFRYDSDWLQNGFAISQQLPLTNKEYSPSKSTSHAFFANLLPEGEARNRIVRNLKIADTDFELLKAIGGECAGALSILPIGHNPNIDFKYKQLTNADMAKLILRKGNVASFLPDKDRPRLSLAGAHDKCPIFYYENNYLLPKDASPSTHILKFELSDYRNILVYEYFLTKLANSIELPTINCQLKKHHENYFLLVERYDRQVINIKNIHRLHQEDFCQALGISSGTKYQQHGGPSFYDCYQLIQNVSSNPIIDSENLLKWQIFNCLAGNSDGHAKNIALIYNDIQQVRLAPFYDLVCTRAIEGIDQRLAMSVGEEFDPDIITININHWEKFSEKCGIRFKYLFELLHNSAEGLLSNLEPTKEQFEADYGRYAALERVKAVVNKQCKKILRLKT